MLTIIFALLVAFQLKHFLADYLLQTEYMLGKFKPNWEFIPPLILHAGLHALMTFLIASLVASQPLTIFVALFDFTAHFTMDRIKASPALLGKYKPLTAITFPKATRQEKEHNKYFWWSLGLDQMVHHLTHYAIIAILLGFR